MSKKESLVSVLLSIYKVEDYLEECLDSILAQSYKNLEVVCVDNGSPDRCGEILKKYAKKDNRIKIVTLKENKMLCGGRNAGLDNATGEFICFVDPDDWIEKDYIKSMVDAILTKRDSEGNEYNMILNADAINYYIDSTGKESHYDVNPPNTTEGEVSYTEINNYTPYETNIPMWSRLYRKSFLDKYNIRFLEGINTDNIPYTFKVLAHMEKFYRIINNSHSFYHRRLITLDGAITVSVLYKNLEIPFCMENLYDYLKEYNLENKIRVPYHLLFTLCFPKHEDMPRYYVAFKNLMKKMEDDIKKYSGTVYQKCDIDLCNLLLYTDNFFQFVDLYFKLIPHCAPKTTSILKLFNFIPLFKKKSAANKTKYYIFGIPVWKVRIKGNTKKGYLFGFIPMIKHIYK